MTNFGPYRIQAPDYVREMNGYANLGANPSTGTGLLGKWVKYNVNFYIHTYVRIRTYTHVRTYVRTLLVANF